MKSLIFVVLAIGLSSCGSTQVAERRPVPPPGSDEKGSIPWNDPGQGIAPGGMLGGMMEGQ